MIYVDSVKPCVPNTRWPWRYSAHLFGDSPEELHRFAKALGLRREWFQAHPMLDHYDLTHGKRKQAVRLGAVEVDNAFVVSHFKQ